MSRAHSTYIPAEEVENATEFNFTAVDQAAIRFAAKLRAQALEEERARDNTARQTGYNEGYAEGFAQGHAQATLEGQKQIAEYIANQGAQEATRLAQLFEAAETQLEQNAQVMSRGVLELACELARQVLRHELSTNPNVLQSVVKEALGMLTLDTKAASLRLNPQDMDVVGANIARDFPNLAITLIPDANVTPGGCLVEAGATVVDGTLQRRWSKVVGALGLESAWEDASGSV